MKVPRLLALAIVAMIGVANPAAGDVTIIHAGWLLASPGKPPVERRSIVVENGRVTAIREGFIGRPDFDVDEPAIHIIDLSQAFVLPGLIDSHVHQ